MDKTVKNPSLFRKELLLFWQRQKVSMVFGQSYPSNEVWEVFKKRREVERDVDGSKIKVNPMEWVAANIASLDWDLVRPDQRPLHKSLISRFASGRNSNLDKLTA